MLYLIVIAALMLTSLLVLSEGAREIALDWEFWRMIVILCLAIMIASFMLAMIV